MPNVLIEGDLNAGSSPTMTLSSTVEVADLAKMGFDASQFASGKVGFVAKPLADGSIEMALDLKDAALSIKDIGITKSAGTPGMLEAKIHQTGDITDISDINLAFGDVRLKGSLEFDAKKGLQSAEFTNFALSPGDAAQLSLTPIKDGFQVRIRGDQLDLKPMLSALLQPRSGVRRSAGDQLHPDHCARRASSRRALGFYKTNAFNVNLDLALKGSDLKKVTLQAQLGRRSLAIGGDQPDARGPHHVGGLQRSGLGAAPGRRLRAGRGRRLAVWCCSRTPRPRSTGASSRSRTSPSSTKRTSPKSSTGTRTRAS